MDFVYNNLTVSNSSSSGASPDAAITASNVLGNVTVAGTMSNGGFTVTGGTGDTFTVSNGGTYKLTGTTAMPTGFTTTTLGASSTVEFAGGVQTVAALTYGNLTFSGSVTPTIAGDATVSGVLALNDRILSTGSNKVIIPNGGSVTRTGATTANGFVSGNLQMHIAAGNAPAVTYHIGSGAAYTPLTIDVGGSGGTAGGLIASTTGSDCANVGTSGLNATKHIARCWSLVANGSVLNTRTYTLTVTFLASDVTGGANTANFRTSRFVSGTTWNLETAGTRTATSTAATGVAAYSTQIAVGESP
jgi:hypothetical protein